MSTLAVEGTMFYCPKCQSKYEDGSQRFCDNDGGRLLPVASASKNGGTQGGGVFTNLLSRTNPRNMEDERLASTPRFVEAKERKQTFEPPSKSKIFKTPKEFNPQIEKINRPTFEKSTPKVESKKVTTRKPLAKVIQSNEISVGRAKLGDRKTNPNGRTALTWGKTDALLGQSVKGRYDIIKTLHQDKTSIAYLAEDRIIKGKKLVVRVLMKEMSRDDFQDNIFAEERVSLSHVNHPNIASVIDSGELPEGKPFIVTEYIEGKSVGEILGESGEVNPMRTARIIRQASLALSEVHQSGVLHRNLKPENILLTISEVGIEQVKVTDFCVSDGKPSSDNLSYKSPEQIGKQPPTFSSDSYSLAVIAYQMLTGQLPFDDSSKNALSKSQHAGLVTQLTDINPDLPEDVNGIMAKALAYNPADRYSKTRDFGEELFDVLTNTSEEDEATDESEPTLLKKETEDIEQEVSSEVAVEEKADVVDKSSVILSDIHISSSDSEDEVEETDTNLEIKAEKDAKEVEKNTALWEKRSPETVKERGWLWTALSIFGLLILLAGVVFAWQFFMNRPEAPVENASTEQTQAENQLPTIDKVDENTEEGTDDTETPPSKRTINVPSGFKYFENSKQDLPEALAKNYRKFSISFPETWSKNESNQSFMDVSKQREEDGAPKEQFIVTSYKSKGTYKEDKPNFPKLVEKSNNEFKEQISKFEMVSEDEIVVNKNESGEGWRAYEVTFKGEVTLKEKDETIQIWGRKMWIPAARPGVTTGFVITMFATSLSDEIEGVEDVGKKGELGNILHTFEPSKEYD